MALSPEANPTNQEQQFDVDERTTGLAYSKGCFGEVPLGLLYSGGDPTCVTLRFDPDAEEPTDWKFSRRVLARGYFEPYGSGDVRVGPWENETLLIQLKPPKAATARIILPLATVRTFLDKSYETVEAKDEGAIIARALDTWLEELIPISETGANTGIEEVPV